MPIHEALVKISNPKMYGPYWYLIHKKAFNTRSQQDKEEFEKFVTWLVSVLLCEDCHKHSTEYLKKNPVRMYFNVKDDKSGSDIGCFKWSWIFHNVINKRLGKKEVDWITALSMYSSDEKCTNCEKKEKDKEKEVRVKVVSKYP